MSTSGLEIKIKLDPKPFLKAVRKMNRAIFYFYVRQRIKKIFSAIKIFLLKTNN